VPSGTDEPHESPDRARAWTTPDAIEARVRRLWDRGLILAADLGGEAIFPFSIPLARPSTRELSDRFDDARRWIRKLESGSKAERSFGYDIHWVDVSHRQLGPQRVPRSVVISTEDDALSMIGMGSKAKRFRVLLGPTLQELPELRAWIAKHPLVVLEHEQDWDRIVRFLVWMRANPRPGIYLRQIELPGIDTKFVERRRALLSALLDCVLPAERISQEVRDFEERYGFRSKPPLIRFRVLDPRCAVGGLTDVSTPASQFAGLALPVRRVFIVENEITGLALPDATESIVIFGLGYGLDRLARVEWLRAATIYYWGDLDTHGFAILDRLRTLLPNVRSLMMDRDTLLAHRAFWVQEDVQEVGPRERLTAEEQTVYEELARQRHGERVRLEQERISFAHLRAAMEHAVQR